MNVPHTNGQITSSTNWWRHQPTVSKKVFPIFSSYEKFIIIFKRRIKYSIVFFFQLWYYKILIWLYKINESHTKINVNVNLTPQRSLENEFFFPQKDSVSNMFKQRGTTMAKEGRIWNIDESAYAGGMAGIYAIYIR